MPTRYSLAWTDSHSLTDAIQRVTQPNPTLPVPTARRRTLTMKLKVWKLDPKLSCTFFAPALILSRATPLHPQYHDYTPDDYEPEFFRSAPPGAFSQCFYTSTRVDLGAINYENDGSTLALPI